MKAITLLVLVLQLVRANFSLETKNGRQNDQESTEDDFQNNLVKRRILVDDDNNGQETSVDDDNKEIDGNRKNKVIKMKNERRLDSSDENNNNSNSNRKQKKKKKKSFAMGDGEYQKEQAQKELELQILQNLRRSRQNAVYQDPIELKLAQEKLDKELNEVVDEIMEKDQKVFTNLNNALKASLTKLLKQKLQEKSKKEDEEEDEDEEKPNNSNSKSEGGRMRKRII